MKDKVILISGGTSGIGLAVAKLFLAQGAQVLLLGRDEARGKAAIESLASPHVQFFSADVSSRKDCQRVMREVEENFQRLDILINSAGIYLEGAIEDMEESALDELWSVNVKGTYQLTQLAVPLLKKSRGNIVNVASDAGVHGNYYCSAYCASKGAVVMFTRALALELAGFGVRVNAIAPGDILTPLTERQLAAMPNREEGLREMSSVYPMGRIGTPEEAANVIFFLASQAAGFVTGAIWGVDGGLTA